MVIKEGDGQADKTSPAEADKKNIGKLFGAKTSADSGAEEKHIAAASASVGAVTGADILKAIAAANVDAKGGGKVKEATDAAGLALAKGTGTDNDDQIKDETRKDAIIAAGVALRAMAKDGKFIVKDNADKKTEAESAKGVASSSVGKMLSTLIIAIRDRVDSGLSKIKEELGKLREEDRVEEVGNITN
ncbi:Variable outer membrane protein (plasmid) [Borrelia crocidurae DOU]|uniref:Variable large protein n=1 Tax=Borrelia crocidurae DOU TaxID=1293575 RepID=W5SKJ7_9SPIR|nr:Variable outer membrane protein [Borrelia crocidurae DOU]